MLPTIDLGSRPNPISLKLATIVIAFQNWNILLWTSVLRLERIRSMGGNFGGYGMESALWMEQGDNETFPIYIWAHFCWCGPSEEKICGEACSISIEFGAHVVIGSSFSFTFSLKLSIKGKRLILLILCFGCWSSILATWKIWSGNGLKNWKLKNRKRKSF